MRSGAASASRPSTSCDSSWDCRVEPDGAIRLGLRYVQGLREEVGRRIEAAGADVDSTRDRRPARGSDARDHRCPKCGNDDERMTERDSGHARLVLQRLRARLRGDGIASSPWGRERRIGEGQSSPRFTSLEHLIAATGVRRDELATLARIGALNGFGYDRRDALWQIERAIRPAGELFEAQSVPFR